MHDIIFKVRKLLLFTGLLALAFPKAFGAPPYRSMSVEEKYAFFAKLHQRLEKGETAKDIEDEFPDYIKKMRTAQHVSLNHWFYSKLEDQSTKSPIVSKEVLKKLGIRVSINPNNGMASVPAGTMHTYGYLFSQLQTPFGLKGKRWIESRIDERLGLPKDFFSPFPPYGEFLTNVTKSIQEILKDGFRDYRYLGFVEEKVRWNMAMATVRTHLINLQRLREFETSETKLLVYEIQFYGEFARLVTVFPITEEAAKPLLEMKPSDLPSDFQPKYNLYIDHDWKVREYTRRNFFK